MNLSCYIHILLLAVLCVFSCPRRSWFFFTLSRHLFIRNNNFDWSLCIRRIYWSCICWKWLQLFSYLFFFLILSKNQRTRERFALRTLRMFRRDFGRPLPRISKNCHSFSWKWWLLYPANAPWLCVHTVFVCACLISVFEHFYISSTQWCYIGRYLMFLLRYICLVAFASRLVPYFWHGRHNSANDSSQFDCCFFSRRSYLNSFPAHLITRFIQRTSTAARTVLAIQIPAHDCAYEHTLLQMLMLAPSRHITDTNVFTCNEPKTNNDFEQTCSVW